MKFNEMKLIKDRKPVIYKYSQNKVVLDVGCVNHDAITEKKTYWLHKNLKKIAKKVVGLDLNEPEVKKLNKQGYDIKIGNVESYQFKEKFDTIVAGELIEHLANPGLFLENMKKQLKKDGYFILTTPNVFCIRFTLRYIFFGKVVPNEEHTCYYDFYTFKQLIERYDLEIVQGYYYFNEITNKGKYLAERMFSTIRKIHAPQMMFVLKMK